VSTRRRVLAALPDHAHGVVLESAGAVSWYLGGARTSVPLGGPSVAVVLVTRDRVEVRCHRMEAERLESEEGVRHIAPVDWAEPLVPDDWRRDPRILAESDLDAELREVRASLTDLELERYRALGADAATVVTAVADTLGPEDAEQTVAGELARGLYEAGAEPVVLLVAGAARTAHRHPLPTAAALGSRAMLVVGARRHGLVVNLTRWVRFGGPVPDGEDRIREVEADVLDATKPGTPLVETLAVLRASYGAHGFDPEEWRHHHQGGPTGYFGRDPKVTTTTVGSVAERQPFAWNPSAPGVKVEDTVVVTAAGLEIVTVDPRWPTTDVAGRPRPLTLQF